MQKKRNKIPPPSPLNPHPQTKLLSELPKNISFKDSS